MIVDPLPDVAAMAALPAACWQALHARLRALGLDRVTADPILRVGGRLPEPLRGPLRRWHLRRSPGPLAWAMRLLMFQDPVAPAEARAVLGTELLAQLTGAGYVVAAADGGVVSPFCLGLANQLFVIYDDLRLGGDAVMGAAETTALLCQAARPTRRLQRVLDLGCGAGTAALLAAPFCEWAIGVDVNPRAVALASINAALNGIANVEFRLGDLFAPVAGETFDLVVSQPPFVSRPSRFDGAAYLYGGSRGDELTLRVLRELPPHLAPGGRAVLFAEWPEVAGESVEARIRAALPDDLNLLLLQMPGADLDEHCAIHALGAAPELDPRFGADAVTRREHFAALGVERLTFTFVVVERTTAPPGWCETLQLPAAARTSVTGDRIDRLLAASSLRRAGDEALLDAGLRLPPGTRFVREHAAGAEPSPTITASFPVHTLREPLKLSEGGYTLVSLVHAAPTVRAAAEAFAARFGAPLEVATLQLLPAVRRALASGVLEPE